jgi:protein TonB
VREGDVVTPGPGVDPPVRLHVVKPQYPPVARRTKASGEVELQALIGTDGTVEEIKIIRSTRQGVGFEDAASDAVREWRYRPATKNGVKVRMWVTIRVPFRI